MAKGKKKFDSNGNELPTLHQLKVSGDEFDRRFNENPEQADKWYSAIVASWQKRRIEEKRNFDVRKAEKVKFDELNHWYNSVDKAKVKALIIQSIPMKDAIISDLMSLISKKSPLTGYYFSLGLRIREDNMAIKILPYSRIKTFPDYDASKDKLTGNSKQFVNMFITCFPPLLRKQGKMF